MEMDRTGREEPYKVEKNILSWAYSTGDTLEGIKRVRDVNVGECHGDHYTNV